MTRCVNHVWLGLCYAATRPRRTTRAAMILAPRGRRRPSIDVGDYRLAGRNAETGALAGQQGGRSSMSGGL
jgi:hypothetical protein